MHAADQLSAGRDVAPLITTAHLQTATLVLIEPDEIIALDQLIAELGEAEAAFQAVLHTVLRHHVVHGDMLAHFADKAQKAHVLEPVVVVDELGRVLRVVEIQEPLQLRLDAGLVVAQCILIQQVTLGLLPAGIAHHARGTTDQRDRTMTAALEMHEHHDLHQIPNVQRIRCGIEADIAVPHTGIEMLLHAGHAVL